MNDFKIGDELGEFNESPTRPAKKQNKVVSIIIVIVVSLLIGILVYVGSNALFGKKDKVEETPLTTELDITDENVEILYQYVTYGTRNKRNEIFISNQSVKPEDFTNEEKFYYALQFAQVEDFVYSGKITDDNKKIYTISSSKIKTYMKRFFGEKLTYKEDCEITYAFSFRINQENVGTLTYSKKDKGYNTVFNGLQEDYVSKDVVEPYYAELVGATENADGTLVLKEKIIYTTVEEQNGIYTVKIYKDYNHNNLIETKQNLTAEQLKANPIDIKDYENKASTIQYNFGLDFTNYYFAGSTIIS